MRFQWEGPRIVSSKCEGYYNLFDIKIQKRLYVIKLSVVFKKKEVALPQHYLSPNQIKPNYLQNDVFRLVVQI